MRRVCVAVAVADQRGSPKTGFAQCSHLHMGSLAVNQIGDAGARDLGAALQVNTTLRTLE
jgi:hypothetical protein